MRPRQSGHQWTSGGCDWADLHGSAAPDVTDVEDIPVGDTATLIGRDGKKELPATEVPDRADSITNELLGRMEGLSHIVV